MKTIVISAFKTTLLILVLAIIAACQPSASEEKKPASAQKSKQSIDHLKDNEELVFGFTTEKGNVLTIAKDKEDKYIIYRFGAPGKVEFEYPPDVNDYRYMTYSSHMSPGNADLNYLRFKTDDFRYVVYDEYIAAEDKHYSGIKLFDRGNSKEYDIKADPATRRGSLIDLRFMNFVPSDSFTL